MDITQFSYLLRYLFSALILFFGWQILRLAVSELRWNFKHSVSPSKGFFLMSIPMEGKEQNIGSVLPIFHTTYIGSSRACDLHLRSQLVFKRHAVIYFFDGSWTIRSVSPKIPVYINHVKILHPIPLENMDEIGIGDYSFTFVDERQSASDAEITYEDYSPVRKYPEEKSSPKLLASYLSLNAFAVLCILLLVLFIPSEHTQVRALITVAAGVGFVLGNLYYFVLPLFLKDIDRALFLLLGFLSVIGITVQIRLSLLPAENLPYFADDMKSQILSILFGFILLPFIAFLTAKTNIPENLGKICAVLTPLFLIMTLILGNGADSHGATLWISVGGMSIQLTEFAKITYLIVLADFFKNRATKKHQLIFAGWAAFVFLLIMLLPDLGSAMILLPTTLIVYVVMTSEYLTTLIILLSGSSLGAIAFALFPHVQRRIIGWTTLWTQVNDNNRQIVYGLQAIARGGLFGKGLGNGSPGGIPLASSDMVFAILCEEFGIVVGLSVVLFFILTWLRSAKIVIRSQDGFSSSLALGIGTLLFVEAAIVISGVTGLFPLTGATLPMIAKGGSSILAILILFALLLGLSARREKGGS